MRLNEFIEKVQSAGWYDLNDAQHKGIEQLWRELYPYSAELEDEMDDIKLITLSNQEF
ncbi:MAG: hypothetical protein JKY81_05825 [Colwellia sp.]|nr:hypothetical protein [Colwellia sp.]